MSTPVAAFAIELKDEASGSAKAASSALSDLKTKIGDDIKALREMQGAMRNLKGNTSASAAQIKDLTEKIAAQRARIAAAQSKYLQLGGTFGGTGVKSATLSSHLSHLGGALGSSGGAAGALGASLGRLAPLLANPIALVAALTTGTLALAAALGVVTAALGRYALAQSDARRSEALRLEGFRSLRTIFGRVRASADEMQGAIDRASDASGLGRGQLDGYARSLARVGFHGEALSQALEGTAIAAQVQGERGAARFRALAIQAALTGRSVADVAEVYRRRLGPIANRVMMSLPNQAARLRMSLERIFSGLRIEAFLGSLDQITRLFSQQTATGRALKTIVEAIFQPMFDATESLGPIFRRFFQGIVIGALWLTIAFLRVRNAIRSAFGDTELLSNQQLMNGALIAGVVVVGALAFALVALAAVLAVVVVSAAAFLATLVAVPAAVAAASAAIGYGLAAAFDWFRNTDFVAMASNVIDGLVAGLTRGVTRIRAAVTSLANTARDSFRSALGIASPSRVFARFGANIAEGVTRGVDGGQGDTQDSVNSLVQVPQGAGVPGGRTTVSTGDIIIQAGETNDPRELAEAFRDQLADILEGVSLELGAAQ